jgi:hypothetical protein
VQAESSLVCTCRRTVLLNDSLDSCLGTFGANPELIAELTNNFEFPRLFSALQNGDKKKNISIRANLIDRSFDFSDKKVMAPFILFFSSF